MHGIADGPCEVRLERLRIVGRIGALRERDDLHVEAEGLRDRELHPAERRLLAGGVGVEAEEEPVRQALQLAQLRCRQRRAHRRDDREEARLAQRDHIGVPLDDDGAVFFAIGCRAVSRP